LIQLFLGKDTKNVLILISRKNVKEDLKKYYKNSNKPSINNNKNTYKKQICNQQEIN